MARNYISVQDLPLPSFLQNQLVKNNVLPLRDGTTSQQINGMFDPKNC